jgi:hypothetical protein
MVIHSRCLVQVMFAWSMTNGWTFPFNFYFVFVLMSVITLFILALSFFLQPSLNTPKPLPSEERKEEGGRRISSSS